MWSARGLDGTHHDLDLALELVDRLVEIDVAAVKATVAIFLAVAK